MTFNEAKAKAFINFLLENDTYEYRRWIPIIKEFNSSQIENLLHGRIQNGEINYPVKNANIFNKLIQKFDNFEKIIEKWYDKEEYYQYIKPLWLKYICIEQINEYLQNNEDLTNYLNSNSINYSQWPEQIKQEFKGLVQKTVGSQIYDANIKLQEECSGFKECYSIMNNILNSFNNLFKEADSDSLKNFESLKDKNIRYIIKSLLSLFSAGLSGVSFSLNKDINYKKTKQFLVKSISEVITDKGEAKEIAKDIIKKNLKMDKEGVLKWSAGFSKEKASNCKGNTILKNCEYSSKEITIDLSKKNDENISFGKSLKIFFKNKVFQGFVLAASVINLGFSIKEHIDTSKIIESINTKIEGEKGEKGKNEVKGYKDKLKEIKIKFEEYIKEVNFKNWEDDDEFLLSKLSYVKNNVENCNKELLQLITEIKTYIKQLEYEKKKSIIGLSISGISGALGVIGIVATGGVSYIINGLNIFCNLTSGGTYIHNIYNCCEIIEKLEDILKMAEKDNEEIQEFIKKLNEDIKQKEFSFPNFYPEIKKIYDKQQIKMKNYF